MDLGSSILLNLQNLVSISSLWQEMQKRQKELLRKSVILTESKLKYFYLISWNFRQKDKFKFSSKSLILWIRTSVSWSTMLVSANLESFKTSQFLT